MRILVTGGSGFIGTNLIDGFLKSGYKVLSIDINEPQNKAHKKIFRNVDILNYSSLVSVFKEFCPTHLVHLAARTDLHETRNIERYRANIDGVKNIIGAVSQQKSVVRCIFTSTKLVSPTDYLPETDYDYCPDTLYGKSKVLGEQIVKNSTELQCDWCILRPTSIWGPWGLAPHIPYGKFFLMIAQGRYFHPGRENPPKSFGYVGNTVYQIMKLLDASSDLIHKQIFYLSDYEVFTIKDWANMISMKLKGKQVKTIPEPIVKLLAWSGDLLKLVGIEEPPFSTFRLRNMRADTSKIPLENLKKITGPLPYSIEQGVEETIAWFKEYKIIKI
jgi:GlcNAc-P-P-Und epimerase